MRIPAPAVPLLLSSPAPTASPFALPHNQRDILLLQGGRLAEAADCFRQAVASAPEFVEAHNNLGFTIGCLDEAWASCRQTLEFAAAG